MWGYRLLLLLEEAQSSGKDLGIVVLRSDTLLQSVQGGCVIDTFSEFFSLELFLYSYQLFRRFIPFPRNYIALLALEKDSITHPQLTLVERVCQKVDPRRKEFDAPELRRRGECVGIECEGRLGRDVQQD